MRGRVMREIQHSKHDYWTKMHAGALSRLAGTDLCNCRRFSPEFGNSLQNFEDSLQFHFPYSSTWFQSSLTRTKA